MRRFIVNISTVTFGQWVWAENKREARKQMQPYAKSIGGKITSVEEVK